MIRLGSTLRKQIQHTSQEPISILSTWSSSAEILFGFILERKGFHPRGGHKLMIRGDGPFQVIEKVGDNVYKLQLSCDMVVSPTFNVGDLGRM